MKAWFGAAASLSFVLVLISASNAAEIRSEKHVAYASKLWDYVQKQPYSEWQRRQAWNLPFGPPARDGAKAYFKAKGSPEGGIFPYGTTAVVEHFGGDDKRLVGLTVFQRVKPGYDKRYKDWYWVHFSPEGKVAETSADKNPHAKRGFVTFVDDGRLWILRAGSAELADFLKRGELAKHVIRLGEGPDGMTVKAPDNGTVLAYLAQQDGFEVFVEDERLWVFRAGSPEISTFKKTGEPAKQVARLGEGPLGTTVKSTDVETIDDYLKQFEE